MEAQDYSRVFVWPFADDPSRIAGFYTLSTSFVERADMSKKIKNKTPLGIPAPVALLGFMGRDDAATKGLGAALMYDAALRVSLIQKSIAIWGLFLHAENGRLAEWYEQLGFYRAERNVLHMYAPLSRIMDLGKIQGP
jgi:hypothetical protein